MSGHEATELPANPALIQRGIRLNLVLVALLALESAALWAATMWLVSRLALESPESFRTAVALTVLTAVAAIWVSFTTFATARRVRWARGSVVTWQILQIAVAFGATQGDRPSWMVALALFVPAVACILLAVSRPIRAAFGVDETPAR